MNGICLCCMDPILHADDTDWADFRGLAVEGAYF